jgi:multiple antibiotic resistance protein
LTAFNVFVILIISFFVGQYVLSFFGITIPALRIAGGLIIASSGFSLLNGQFKKNKGINKEIEEEIQSRNDIALTPLAMPMLAGPGSISLLIAFHQEHNSTSEIIYSCFAILTVAILIYIILKSAHFLARILGSAGIVAISRIVGFLTIAIGIQYIISSILTIIQDV